MRRALAPHGSQRPRKRAQRLPSKDAHMFKRLIAALLAFFALSVFAADANNASLADLEAIKGIGPAIAGKIVDERKNGAYKDWPDLITRVKGTANKTAVTLSAAGLTVNGAAMSGAPAAPAAPAKTTAAAAAPAKVATPAPASAPAPGVAGKPAPAAKPDRASAAAEKRADKAAAKPSAAAAASAAKK